MLAYTYSNTALECGTDEAGRGCLAGPVTAAAVINPLFVNEELTNHDVKSFLKQLNDSKQLSEKKRDTLKPYIEKWAYCFAVTHIFNEEIDKINILNASIKAMQECVLKLKSKPSYIIVDGNSPFIPKSGIKNNSGNTFSANDLDTLQSIPSESIVKGDGKYVSIAAASILAKTYRDEYMNLIHEEYPMYNWKKNKGYPTKEHREAIRKYGVTPYHRLSFKLLPDQLTFDL